MTIKKFSALCSAVVLALASLFTLALVGKAQAVGTTLYWCEFSSNGSFNTASNWNTNSSCSGGTQEVPVSGDVLVFNNTNMNSALNITDNISGLDLASITFTGSGTGAYNLSGDDFSLDGGITDAITGNLNEVISNNVTLTANQSFTNQSGDNLFISGTLNIGSANLTLATKASAMTFDSTVSGTGTITMSSPPGGTQTALYNFTEADTGLSGPIVVDSGAIAEDSSNTFNGLGSGSITVNNGGALLISSTATTGTLANTLNLAGSGVSGTRYAAITSCLDNGSGCTGANTTLTLSGKATFSANTVVVNGAYTVGEGSPPAHTATFTFTGGGVYNGFSLSGLSNTSTVLNSPTAIVTPSASSSGSATTTVKAPDTGEALAANRVYLEVIGVVLIAAALVISSVALSRRSNKSISSRK